MTPTQVLKRMKTLKLRLNTLGKWSSDEREEYSQLLNLRRQRVKELTNGKGY